METFYTYNGKKYHLTNEDLKVGDNVFPISHGKVTNGSYEHHQFDFRDHMSGFPDNHHIILDLHYSDDKAYEVRTDHGFCPAECYFKIVLDYPLNT